MAILKLLGGEALGERQIRGLERQPSIFVPALVVLLALAGLSLRPTSLSLGAPQRALVAVLLVGEVRFGARRWLSVGGIALQVSELVKLIIIVALARFFSEVRVVVPEEKLRNNDAEYLFRQDSDFYWLTGFDEPEGCAVLSALVFGGVKGK